MIFKIRKHTQNFVILQKTVLELPNLSWKAKGLWAYLMSLPDNWSVSTEHLSKNFPSGRDMIRGTINELEKHGLCRKIRKRNEKGQIETVEYEIFEEPIKDIECGKPEPRPEKPGLDNPGREKSALIRNKTNKEEKEEISIPKGIDNSSERKKTAPSKCDKIIFNKDNFTFEGIEEKDIQSWNEAYPGVNLKKEFARMSEWIQSNPTKGNKSRWRKFITTWLAKVSDQITQQEARKGAFQGIREVNDNSKVNTSTFYDLRSRYPESYKHCFVKNGYLYNPLSGKEVKLDMHPDKFDEVLVSVARKI